MNYSVNLKKGTYYVQFRITENGKVVHKCKSTGIREYIEEEGISKREAKRKAKEQAEQRAREIIDCYDDKSDTHLVSLCQDTVQFINTSISDINSFQDKDKATSAIMLLNMIGQLLNGISMPEYKMDKIEIVRLLGTISRYIIDGALMALNDRGNQLLADCVLEYVEHRKTEISVTTYDNYMSIYNKHIKPYFEANSITLKDLTPTDIEKYAQTKKSEITNNTIVKHLQLLSASLTQAQHDGKITTNPAQLAKIGKRQKPQHSVYNEEELCKALKVVTGTNYETPVYLATFLGLRRSEILGLRWENVNLEESEISICDTTVLSHGKIVFRENTTKTEDSCSTMFLPDFLCRYLKALKAKQETMPRRTTDYMDFVCVDIEGKLIHPDTLSKEFPKLMVENGLKRIKLHELRHSLVTLADKYGGIEQASKIARHTDTKITERVYVHQDFKQTYGPLMEKISKAILSADSGEDNK